MHNRAATSCAAWHGLCVVACLCGVRFGLLRCKLLHQRRHGRGDALESRANLCQQLLLWNEGQPRAQHVHQTPSAGGSYTGTLDCNPPNAGLSPGPCGTAAPSLHSAAQRPRPRCPRPRASARCRPPPRGKRDTRASMHSRCDTSNADGRARRRAATHEAQWGEATNCSRRNSSMSCEGGRLDAGAPLTCAAPPPGLGSRSARPC